MTVHDSIDSSFQGRNDVKFEKRWQVFRQIILPSNSRVKHSSFVLLDSRK